MTTAGIALDRAPRERFGLLDPARSRLLWRRIDGALLKTPPLLASYFSKLSIPPFGAMGLTLAIPLLAAAAGVGLATQRLVLNPARFLGFLALLAFLLAVQVLRPGPFSLPSLLLFAVLHFPYCLELRRAVPYERIAAGFGAVALSIAVLGLAQYAVQFALGPTLAFPIENFVPESLKVAHFNMQGRLEYGAEVYRTNGIFMLEPSFYSQFLAFGLVLELMFRRRAWALLLLAAGIAVSFSGTGLIVLLAVLPCWAVARGHLRGLLAAAAGTALLVWAAAALDNAYLNVFFKRAGELTSPGSSGFARFVGGFYLFEEFLWPDPLRSLFGFGAGSLQTYLDRATWAGGGNAFFKTVFEFGLVGATAYFLFLARCLRDSAAPWPLKVGVAVSYLLGGLLVPFAHAVAFGLLVWPGRGAAR